MNNADEIHGTPAVVVGETPTSPAPTESTVPATVAVPKRERKPRTRTTSVTTVKTDPVAAFRAAFPKTATVWPWLAAMVAAFRAIHANVPADKRGSYDTVLAVAKRHITRPDVGHAFTLGSGRDIAQTQNAIYVGLALSGITRAEIPNAFGAALWRAVIGKTSCEYRDHTDYFASTGSAVCGARHNDCFGLSAATIRPVVNRWFNPTKS